MLSDVFKPYMAGNDPCRELVSAQYIHYMVDDTVNYVMAFPIGDRYAHFTVYGTPPSKERQSTVTPPFDMIC
jgi:hypothetical protein